jgi:hypothetical protein
MTEPAGYLQKPVTEEALQQALARALGEPSRGRLPQAQIPRAPIPIRPPLGRMVWRQMSHLQEGPSSYPAPQSVPVERTEFMRLWRGLTRGSVTLAALAFCTPD